jgi:hypothetical protein
MMRTNYKNIWTTLVSTKYLEQRNSIKCSSLLQYSMDAGAISKDAKNGMYAIRGHATLEDVCAVLDWELDDTVKEEFATISGFLCASARHIPKPGEIIHVDGGYQFTIVEVEDNRKIRSITISQESLNQASKLKVYRDDTSFPRSPLESAILAGPQFVQDQSDITLQVQQ